jgi:cytidylate kinase
VDDLSRQIPKRGSVVAIDGPAGAGKSTLARELARRLELPYINTGLMYRAVAARALVQGVPPDDAGGLAEIARSLRFSLSASPSPSELVIDGYEPGSILTSAQVEAIVSEVARHPEVRSVLRRAQRTLGAGGCVMEGRDIGTVVFPDADVKIFLSAAPEIRVRRRERERGAGADVGASVFRRDSLDAKTNPLEPAADAHVLDTTRLGAREVLAQALTLVGGVLETEATE